MPSDNHDTSNNPNPNYPALTELLRPNEQDSHRIATDVARNSFEGINSVLPEELNDLANTVAPFIAHLALKGDMRLFELNMLPDTVLEIIKMYKAHARTTTDFSPRRSTSLCLVTQTIAHSF